MCQKVELGKKLTVKPKQICDEYQQIAFPSPLYCTPEDLVKKLRVRPSYKFHLTAIVAGAATEFM